MVRASGSWRESQEEAGICHRRAEVEDREGIWGKESSACKGLYYGWALLKPVIESCPAPNGEAGRHVTQRKVLATQLDLVV